MMLIDLLLNGKRLDPYRFTERRKELISRGQGGSKKDTPTAMTRAPTGLDENRQYVVYN
jgi:hypothetical protein